MTELANISTQISLFQDGSNLQRDLRVYFAMKNEIKSAKLYFLLKGMADLLQSIESSVPEDDRIKMTGIRFAFPLISKELPGISFQEAKKYHDTLCSASPLLMKKLEGGEIADGVFINAAKQPLVVQEKLSKECDRIRGKDVTAARNSYMKSKTSDVLQMAIDVPVAPIESDRWVVEANRYADNLHKIVPSDTRASELIQELKEVLNA